jgi:hypothetical protein
MAKKRGILIISSFLIIILATSIAFSVEEDNYSISFPDGDNEDSIEISDEKINETINETNEEMNQSETITEPETQTNENQTEIIESIEPQPINETEDLEKPEEKEEIFFGTLVDSYDLKDAEVRVYQHPAKIGEPVRWEKSVNSKKSGKISIEIPKDSSNVELIKVRGEYAEIDLSPMTGKTISGFSEDSFLGKILKFFKRLLEGGITGRMISDSINEKLNININVDDTSSEYVIIYETPAPGIVEERVSPKIQRFTVYGSEEVHYTNILAFANLSTEVSPQRIKFYYLNGNIKEEVELKKIDTNNNGLIDYIEWTVPSLSNKTYEIIIEITSAEHLDENREFIKDIYPQVSVRDDIWSEPIPQENFVRVSFEKNLTSKNDITIFARAENTAYIEVYIAGTDELVATFDEFKEEGRYSIFLNSLENNSYDKFDLKIKGSAIEFDYIVDPYKCTGTANSCGTFGTSGTCTGQQGCFWSGGSCRGTATQCNMIYSEGSCTDQTGCSWTFYTGDIRISRVRHNNTIPGQSTQFSIRVTDQSSTLHSSGGYIFSTNNTGTWVNESFVPFSATPSWANVTKTLNSTAGNTVCYRWYINNTNGDRHDTDIFCLPGYKIYDCAGLQAITGNLHATYLQMNDIYCYESTNWNEGEGFLPLGESINAYFGGVFDGQGHRIYGITMNRTGYSYTGLFGYIAATGTIKNIGLEDVSIKGDTYIGALVGYSWGGFVNSSYSKGIVNITGSDEYSYAGGLIGGTAYDDLVLNSYSHANVSGGNEFVGGLIGRSGSLTNCYSKGHVNAGGTFVGGLTGQSQDTITNSFYDNQTSGQTGGTIARTTAQMKTMSTFTGWSIANHSTYTNQVWRIDNGYDYPRLGWETSKQYNITLRQGWNTFAITLAHTDTGSDKNITLGNAWTLIGHSGNKTVNVSSLFFHQQGGSSYTWQSAIVTGKVQAYMVYVNGSQYKTVGQPNIFPDTTFLNQSVGYFVRTNEVNGSLTLPGTGGTDPAKSFHWNDIRFLYGGEEKNVDDAYEAGWIFAPNGNPWIYWHNVNTGAYDNVCGTGYCSEQNLYPWQGYWIYSKHNNVIMVLRS